MGLVALLDKAERYYDCDLKLKVTGEDKEKVGGKERNSLRWTAFITGSRRLSTVRNAFVSFAFPSDCSSIVDHLPKGTDKPLKQIDGELGTSGAIVKGRLWTQEKSGVTLSIEETGNEIILKWEFKSPPLNNFYSGSVEGEIVLSYLDECKDKTISFKGSLEVDLKGGRPFRRTCRYHTLYGKSGTITLTS